MTVRFATDIPTRSALLLTPELAEKEYVTVVIRDRRTGFFLGDGGWHSNARIIQATCYDTNGLQLSPEITRQLYDTPQVQIEVPDICFFVTADWPVPPPPTPSEPAFDIAELRPSPALRQRNFFGHPAARASYVAVAFILGIAIARTGTEQRFQTLREDLQAKITAAEQKVIAANSDTQKMAQAASGLADALKEQTEALKKAQLSAAKMQTPPSSGTGEGSAPKATDVPPARPAEQVRPAPSGPSAAGQNLWFSSPTATQTTQNRTYPDKIWINSKNYIYIMKDYYDQYYIYGRSTLMEAYSSAKEACKSSKQSCYEIVVLGLTGNRCVALAEPIHGMGNILKSRQMGLGNDTEDARKSARESCEKLNKTACSINLTYDICAN